MLADFIEGAGLAPVQTETQPKDLPFPLIEGDKHLVDLARQQGRGRGVERGDGRAVLDDVTELGVAVLTEGFGK